MIKVFMLNPKAERQASPGVPYVELFDYLSLESRHRDLVAIGKEILRRLEDPELSVTYREEEALREALKDESNPPGEAPK